MRIATTEIQSELQNSVRMLFEKECPKALVRSLQSPDTQMRPDGLWSALAETGMLGLPFEEDLGGQGAGVYELGLLFQEAGRALCPTIVQSTMAFGVAVDALGTEHQRSTWIPKISDGSVRGTVALYNPSDSSDLQPSIIAQKSDSGWLLSGTVDFVPNADVVDAVLVSARTSVDGGAEEILVFVIAPGRPGWSDRRHRTFSREIQCRVRLDGYQVDADELVAELGASEASYRQLGSVADILISLQAMEMLGGAQAALDQSVDYVSVREQFGRTLATFQAVQHHIANMRIAVDAARLAANQAMWMVGRGLPAQREVAIAKYHANEAYKTATLTAHQLFGGMGYMRETDLHLWSERAKALELLGGGSDVQLERLEQLLGLEASGAL